MTKIVYILLPVYNRKDITLSFIQQLKNQTYTTTKLLVIDDGSTDGTADEVQQKFPEVEILRGAGNWWWGGSLHQGYKWLKRNAKQNSVVLILNDDCFIKPDFISTGINLLNQNTKSLILPFAYDKTTNNFVDAGVHFDFKQNQFNVTVNNSEINCLSTRGLFLRVEDFFSIGGFYPFLLPHYLSDYEFTIRAFHKGFKLRSFESLKLWFNTESTGIEALNRADKNFFKHYFSKKYKENPFYLFNFYLLAFPFPYNLYHAMRLVKNTLQIIFSKNKSN